MPRHILFVLHLTLVAALTLLPSVNLHAQASLAAEDKIDEVPVTIKGVVAELHGRPGRSDRGTVVLHARSAASFRTNSGRGDRTRVRAHSLPVQGPGQPSGTHRGRPVAVRGEPGDSAGSDTSTREGDSAEDGKRQANPSGRHALQGRDGEPLHTGRRHSPRRSAQGRRNRADIRHPEDGFLGSHDTCGL